MIGIEESQSADARPGPAVVHPRQALAIELDGPSRPLAPPPQRFVSQHQRHEGGQPARSARRSWRVIAVNEEGQRPAPRTRPPVARRRSDSPPGSIARGGLPFLKPPSRTRLAGLPGAALVAGHHSARSDPSRHGEKENAYPSGMVIASQGGARRPVSTRLTALQCQRGLIGSGMQPCR